jgi:prepilin-type N-terminal cleavage/methylation domain-containing protein
MDYCKKLFGHISQFTKGFSLIELLVVIGILGLMATITVTIINPTTQLNKSQDGIRKSDLLKLQSALELYRGNNVYYPPTLSLLTSGTPKYLETQPTDPKTGVTYEANYQALPSGCNNVATFCTTYSLWACLQYAQDPKADTVTQSNCTVKSYTVRNP